MKRIRESIDRVFSQYDSKLSTLFYEGLDPITVNHSINTALLAVNYYTVNSSELGDLNLDDIVLASLLHDIGKADVLDLVKLKRDFTEEERLQVQEHPKLGYRRAIEFGITSETVLSAIYNHHRRVDGTGYPELKKDLEPTEFDYVFGFIDSFEAMVTDKRPYKEGMCRVEAITRLVKDTSDGQYSVHVCENFLNTLKQSDHYVPASQLVQFDHSF